MDYAHIARLAAAETPFSEKTFVGQDELSLARFPSITAD